MLKLACHETTKLGSCRLLGQKTSTLAGFWCRICRSGFIQNLDALLRRRFRQRVLSTENATFRNAYNFFSSCCESFVLAQEDCEVLRKSVKARGTPDGGRRTSLFGRFDDACDFLIRSAFCPLSVILDLSSENPRYRGIYTGQCFYENGKSLTVTERRFGSKASSNLPKSEVLSRPFFTGFNGFSQDFHQKKLLVKRCLSAKERTFNENETFQDVAFLVDHPVCACRCRGSTGQIIARGHKIVGRTNPRGLAT